MAAAAAGGMRSNRQAGCGSFPPALSGSATRSPPHGPSGLKGCAIQPDWCVGCAALRIAVVDCPLTSPGLLPGLRCASLWPL